MNKIFRLLKGAIYAAAIMVCVAISLPFLWVWFVGRQALEIFGPQKEELI